MKHSEGFLKLVNDAKTRVKEIDIEAYRKLLASAEPHVLWIRAKRAEWVAGHVAGAIHLSKGIIERDIETRVADHAATLVLYCGGGFRSALAADNLQKDGLHERHLARWRLARAKGIGIGAGVRVPVAVIGRARSSAFRAAGLRSYTSGISCLALETSVRTSASTRRLTNCLIGL